MGSNYSALDFGFLYVKDMSEKDAIQTVVTADDNLPRMNVWILQDTEKADLLKMVVKPDNLEYTSALIVLDFDQPWEMMDALNRWMRLLSEIVQGAMKNLSIDQQDELKRRISMHIKNYVRVSGAESGDQAAADGGASKGKKKDRKNQKKKGREEESDGESDIDDVEDEDMLDLKN